MFVSLNNQASGPSCAIATAVALRSMRGAARQAYPYTPPTPAGFSRDASTTFRI